MNELNTEFYKLEEKFNKIVEDFKNSKVDLNASIERMAYRLGDYIKACERIPLINENSVSKNKKDTANENKDSRSIFIERLSYLKKDIFNDDKIRTVLLAWLKPSLAEIVEAIYNKESVTYQDIVKAAIQKFKAPVISILEKTKNDTLQEIKSRLVKIQTDNINTDLQLNDAFEQLQRDFNKSIENFKNNENSLSVTIKQMLNNLYEYIWKYISSYKNYSKDSWVQVRSWPKYLYEAALENYKNQSLKEIEVTLKKALDLYHIQDSQSTQDKLLNEYENFKKKITENKKNKNSIQQIREGLNEYITNISAILKADNSLEEKEKQDFNDLMEYLSNWRNKREEIIEDTTDTKSYKKLIEVLNDKESGIYIQIIEAINCLPKQVKDSVIVLAQRAQGKVKSIDEELNQFKQEIEIWYDRSMDRATGVYKRNTKGFTFIIGFALAALANVDTFHIINRLSKDKELRTVITQRAIEQTKSSGDDENTKKTAEQDLNDIFLPIGWQLRNLRSQMGCTVPSEAEAQKIAEAQKYYFVEFWSQHLDQPLKQVCGQLSPKQNSKSLPLAKNSIKSSNSHRVRLVMGDSRYFPNYEKNLGWIQHSKNFLNLILRFLSTVLNLILHFPNIIMGWILSGFAVIMGASFWFDLLNKLINVRNTGPRPASSANNEAANTQTAQNTSTRTTSSS